MSDTLDDSILPYVLDHLPQGVCVLKHDWTVQYWNHCLVEWTGIASDAIVHRAIGEYFPHLREARYHDRLAPLFSGGPPATFAPLFHPQFLPCSWPDGRPRIQSTVARAIPSPVEHEWLLLLVIHDVTGLQRQIETSRQLREKATAEAAERQRAERQAHEAYRQTQLVLTSAGEGIVGVDSTGELTFVNPAAAHMLRYQPKELVGMPLRTIIHPPSHVHAGTPPASCRMCALPRDETVFHEEDETFWRKNGTPFPVEYTSTPIRDAHGKSQGAVLTFKDISERKRVEEEQQRLQQQLVDASRTAGMSEIATSILHNMGNVLNSTNISAQLLIEHIAHLDIDSLKNLYQLVSDVTSSVHTLLAQDPTGRKIPEFLYMLTQDFSHTQARLTDEADSIRKHVEHMRSIILAQQRHVRLHAVTESVDPCELLEDALKMSSVVYDDLHIDVRRHYELVDCLTIDRQKVLQILVNLLQNARHALREAVPEHPRIDVTVTSWTHQGVEISVTDNGIGIAEKIAARIFECGFTTKPNGNGFGLHTGAIMAQELGGTLCMESKGPGHGSTFTLRLPFAHAVSQDADTSAHTVPTEHAAP